MDTEITRQHDMPEQTIDERIRRAEVLIEALPYIKRFSGHILVVKVGGAAIRRRRPRLACSRTSCCCASSA